MNAHVSELRKTTSDESEDNKNVQNNPIYLFEWKMVVDVRVSIEKSVVSIVFGWMRNVDWSKWIQSSSNLLNFIFCFCIFLLSSVRSNFQTYMYTGNAHTTHRLIHYKRVSIKIDNVFGVNTLCRRIERAINSKHTCLQYVLVCKLIWITLCENSMKRVLRLQPTLVNWSCLCMPCEWHNNNKCKWEKEKQPQAIVGCEQVCTSHMNVAHTPKNRSSVSCNGPRAHTHTMMFDVFEFLQSFYGRIYYTFHSTHAQHA